MSEEAEYSYLYSLKSKNGKGLNKRRFNDEQIKSLESMFESETRLEPTKKLQVASDLGLQPRQVAIWFQNKRARWKSKQLERDYNTLLSNFDSLTARFEALKKEKLGLVAQLQKLNGDLQKQRRAEEGGENEAPSARAEPSEDVKAECLGLGYDEEPDHLLGMDMVEPADSSLTSPDEWDHLNSETLFVESASSYDQWLNFWS